MHSGRLFYGEEAEQTSWELFLIPMVVAPLISNPIIKRSGEFIDENGFTEYLPTHTLLLVGAVLVLFTLLPMIPAKRYHDQRIHRTTGQMK